MKVLFICHANVCRSFMAQELLRKLRPDVEVFSRGMYVDPAYQIPQKVMNFLESQHIFPLPHIPTQVSAADLSEADHIFCMEQAHLDAILDRYAQYTDKCYLLPEFVFNHSENVPDPIGLSGRAFIQAAEKLKLLVTELAEKLI